MKKTLNTTGITNELKGASVFFAPDSTAPKPPPRTRPSKAATPQTAIPAEGLSEKEKPASVQTTHQADTAPATSRQKAGQAASTQAPTLARYPADKIAAIRQVVRVLGKEVAFVRLTPAEKRRLGEAVYTYKCQDIKTSENEVLRIGLAYLLADYAENGQESVLARVIDALNA